MILTLAFVTLLSKFHCFSLNILILFSVNTVELVNNKDT